MIGKKAAIGIIAATGVVAVGVPVGIVVGQHASKTGSLDSKMQSKWSDIERELASSFGGFDVRNAESVDANQKERDAQLKVVTDTKTLIDRVVGTSKDSYFNSFTQIDKNMNEGVEKLRAFAEKAINEYASKGLEVVNGKIVAKAPDAASKNLTFKVSENKDGTSTLQSISASSAPDDVTWFAAPFETKFSVIKDGSNDKIVSSIDVNSFDAFIYEGQLSNGTKLQQTPLGQFRNLVKEFSRTSNQYKLPDLASKVAGLIGDHGTLGYFVNGKLSSAPNIVNDQSLAHLFGLKNIMDLLPLSANNGADVLTKITDEIFVQTEYLDYSVRGHHDEMLVKASIANRGEDNTGDDFTAKGFTWTAPTPANPKPAAPTDQIFTWTFTGTNGEIYRDANGKYVASTADESITPDATWKKSYFELKDAKSERFANSNAAIDAFNAQNAAKGLHTFTNEERFLWCVEEAKMKDIDGNDLPGESIEKLSPIFKEAKINYQSAKEWYDQGEFSLLLNQGQFDSVLRKFNISPAEADFQITISNENGSKYVLVVAPNGQLYLKGDANQTPLFTKGLTEEDKAKYPMASPEWYSANNQIAYSQSTTASSIYDLETNAPFVLGNNTTISFALAIRNKETNTEYKNTDAGRKAQVFGLNQDGELFVNNEGAKA